MEDQEELIKKSQELRKRIQKTKALMAKTMRDADRLLAGNSNASEELLEHEQTPSKGETSSEKSIEAIAKKDQVVNILKTNEPEPEQTHSQKVNTIEKSNEFMPEKDPFMQMLMANEPEQTRAKKVFQKLRAATATREKTPPPYNKPREVLSPLSNLREKNKKDVITAPAKKIATAISNLSTNLDDPRPRVEDPGLSEPISQKRKTSSVKLGQIETSQLESTSPFTPRYGRGPLFSPEKSQWNKTALTINIENSDSISRPDPVTKELFTETLESTRLYPSLEHADISTGCVMECENLEDTWPGPDELSTSSLFSTSHCSSTQPTPSPMGATTSWEQPSDPLTLPKPSTSSTMDPCLVTPLYRSVSSYRREQKLLLRKPKAQNEHITIVSKRDKDKTNALENRIKALQDQINILQPQLEQARSAMNYAASSNTMRNSVEDLEAQSLAFQVKKQITLLEEELVRLRMDNDVHAPTDDFYDTGSLTIKNLNIHLDIGQMEQHQFTYYAFAIISVGPTMVKTKVVPLTAPIRKNTFALEEHITITDVFSDFDAKVDIYAIRIPKETIDTPAKKKMRIVPKKKDTPIKTPVTSSQLFSGKVPDFAFHHSGFAVFSLKQLSQAAFSMTIHGDERTTVHNILPLVSKPLIMQLTFDGNKDLVFKSMINYYKRTSMEPRHCSLDGDAIKLYRYPDDEGVKEPLAAFNVKDIISEPEPASEEMTIVPNSFIFTVQTPLAQKQHIFVAINKTQMREWIRAIKFYMTFTKPLKRDNDK